MNAVSGRNRAARRGRSSLHDPDVHSPTTHNPSPVKCSTQLATCAMLFVTLRDLGNRHRIILCGILALGGCDSKSREKAPEPGISSADSVGTAKSREGTLSLDPQTSSLEMKMLAELENIQGSGKQGLTGEISFDPQNVLAASGTVRFDLTRLRLLHAIKRGDTEEMGELRSSSKQNDDMRIWLEIASDTPEETLKRYRYATFAFERVKKAVPTALPSEPGEYKLSLVVEGAFELHGHTVRKTVPLNATVTQTAAGVTQVRARTAEPLTISLTEHDVRPRTAFGILADRTLDAMGKKVAKTPQVQLELRFLP